MQRKRIQDAYSALRAVRGIYPFFIQVKGELHHGIPLWSSDERCFVRCVYLSGLQMNDGLSDGTAD